MATLVFLIEQVAIGLYIFIGLGIFLALRRLGRSNAAYRATRFELQRDIARFGRANAITSLILLIQAGLLVYGVQSVVAPTLRETLVFTVTTVDVVEDLDFNTATPLPLAQLSIDDSGVDLGALNQNQIRISPTPTSTPVGTIEPNAPAMVGCDAEGATLQIPANGQVIREIVPVRGTAFTDNFAFFKLEIAGDVTGGNFASMESFTQPVEELGTLSQFNPAFYPEGTYRFRLAVFDITDSLKASCTVTIYIRPPESTSTPVGQ